MNPFRYGGVVSGAFYCHRPALEEELRRRIDSSQNTWIQGERRTGKTSLVQQTIRTTRRKSLYVDLWQIKTTGDLCLRIARAIITLEKHRGTLDKFMKGIAALRPKVSLDPYTTETSLSFSSEREAKPDSVEHLLEYIDELNRQLSLCVVFDEFQDILKLDEHPKVLGVMRSKIQFQHKTPYIFVGSFRNVMSHIFTSPDSAFYKSALPMEVGPIAEDPFTQFIEKHFLQTHRKLLPAALAQIFELTGGITGDIQEICSAIWDTTEPRTTIDTHHIAHALEHVFRLEHGEYEAHLSTLTHVQTRFLIAVAKLGGKNLFGSEFQQLSNLRFASTIVRTARKLETQRIIYKKGDRYLFFNPFFAIWIKRHY